METFNPKDIDSAKITRLLHLAIIAQIQAWEAISSLELMLESELVSGSPEHRALRCHISDAVCEMASDPDKPLPELLTDATAAALIETLATFPKNERTTE